MAGGFARNTGTVCSSCGGGGAVGIEAAMAPLGCLLDIDGNITDKVFLCKVIDEVTEIATFNNLSVNLATGLVTNPYVGPFEECPEKDNILETDYCYIAIADGTGYSAKDTLQYSILSDLSYVEWFNQNTGLLIYFAINGVPTGTIPDLNDLRSCESRPEVITPSCYEWTDPLDPSIINKVTAYASTGVQGEFCEWIVTDGTPPADLTLDDALTPCFVEIETIRTRHIELEDADVWPVALQIEGNLQSYTITLTSGTMTSPDIVTSVATPFPPGIWTWEVTGKNQVLIPSVFTIGGGGTALVQWTEEI